MLRRVQSKTFSKVFSNAWCSQHILDFDESVGHRIFFSVYISIHCFSFLGKPDAKEEIMNFDPYNVTSDNRESVEQLLRKKADAFKQENAAKASQIADRLVAWVTTNVKYSKVLEKIRPLEDKQKKLEK